MSTEQQPPDSARRCFDALTRRPRRRLVLLLLSLLIGILGVTYFPEPLLSLADDALGKAASIQQQRGVETKTRYISEIYNKEVVDPETGERSFAPVTRQVPVTETLNPGGPPGGYMLQPAPVAASSAAERRANELAQRIRQIDSQTEQEPLRQELAEALGEAFDERRQQQQQAIERLELQLKSLRELAAKRDDRKDEIIQRRIAELLGQPDPLAWDAALRPATGSYYGTAPVPQSLPALPPPVFLPAAPVPAFPLPAPPMHDPSADPALDPVSPSAVPAAELAGDFDAAERLLSRLIELRQLRSEIKKWQLPLPNEDSESDSPEAGERAAKNREREQAGREQYLQGLLAKERAVVAKLELAEIAWQAVEQPLRNEVKAAERRAQTAADRAENASRLRLPSGTTNYELQAAQQAQAKSELDLEAAKQRLAAWEKTEAILRKQREALE